MAARKLVSNGLLIKSVISWQLLPNIVN